MKGFLSNLTATLLAVHTVLGCCGHHAHRCAEACDAEAIVAVAAPSDHDCEHAVETSCHAQGHEHQGHEHHGHECLGNTCVFLGALKTQLSKTAVLGINAPAVLASNANQAGFYPEGVRTHESLDAPMPPLRRHLLCSVLLI